MEKVVNILLVEDDKLDVMDIQRTLDKLRIVYKMDVASNGEDALRMLEERKLNYSTMPDITLIDINMPKMNGLELLSAIRASNSLKDLKCFIITTSDDKVDKEAAKKLGVSGYIVKPFKTNNNSSLDSFHLMIDLMNNR